MPSLSSCPERHVVIDRRAGHYLCFPDVCLTDSGDILCAYNEFDRHVGTRRRLLLKRSADGGATWGRAVMIDAYESHCPRLARVPNGSGVAGQSVLALLHDAGPVLYWSTDDGLTWVRQAPDSLAHGLLDRIIPLDGGEDTPGAGELLFTTGHQHRGSQPQPRIRQAPTEQLAYISRNRGRRWEAYSVIANEKCLVLCEASVIRLPRPKGDTNQAPLLLALMRENSFVGEPMYFCLSQDGGATWSQPQPTPLIGHRPTLGLTRSGKLLVTYRCVGPDPGTKAWLGTVDELCSGFRVHGLHPNPQNPRLIPEGLLMQTAGGPGAPVRYALRPLTDPNSATASLEAEVLVRESELNGCGLHLGMWWKLYSDCLVPDCDVDADGVTVLPVEYEPGVFHSIRVDYEPGLCRLFVDGKPRGVYPVDRMSGDTRPILAGSIARKDDNACEALWRKLSLTTHEPSLGRDYDWSWSHTSGEMPDAWIDSRVLELQNDRNASPADFGYSGWVELPTAQEKSGKSGGRKRKGGRFFCAYHHGGGTEPGYKPGESAHVVGTWFDEKDFPFTRKVGG